MHPFLLDMKVIINSLILAAIFLFSSCGSSISPEDPEPLPGTFDPDKTTELVDCMMSLNGQEYTINSVGYYHNIDRKGFDFVFSIDALDFSQFLFQAPLGFTFILDIPESAFGYTKELPYVIEDSKWDFYYSYALNGVDASVENSPMIVASSIKSGSMNIKLKDGELTLNFSSVDNNGDKLECVYQGRPFKSDHYIWWN